MNDTAELVEAHIGRLSEAELNNGKADRLRYVVQSFPQVSDLDTILEIESGMDQST